MSWGVGVGGSGRVSDSVSKSAESVKRCRKVPKSVEKCEKRGVLVLGSWGDASGSWGAEEVWRSRGEWEGRVGESDRVSDSVSKSAERCRKVPKTAEKCRKV
jgi:hypothetical protein